MSTFFSIIVCLLQIILIIFASAILKTVRQILNLFGKIAVRREEANTSENQSNVHSVEKEFLLERNDNPNLQNEQFQRQSSACISSSIQNQGYEDVVIEMADCGNEENVPLNQAGSQKPPPLLEETNSTKENASAYLSLYNSVEDERNDTNDESVYSHYYEIKNLTIPQQGKKKK
ncbi:uncharacterized protein LOC131928981 [Physella acuta]|uniref:uncharacterized protein LOC131928981 n=1 Tax=Physella acuta TaxID=109671 RepID=UPI0027DD8E8A|nr:uncharacterized protein LOC131928981 [Physella acuta]